MAFKHREAKRKKRAASARERASVRASGGSDRWWLTLVTQTTCCANPACHGILRVGAEMVFRKVPQAALCVACADREGIHYRPSGPWERSRRVKGRR